MSDEKFVPARSTVTLGVVNGDLTVGAHATVKGAGSPPAIRVNGTIYCEGHNTFEGNVTVEGFEAEERAIVRGDLDVNGNV